MQKNISAPSLSRARVSSGAFVPGACAARVQLSCKGKKSAAFAPRSGEL